MRYRAEIDGLRALAVVPVVLFHAGLPHLQGGFVGVDVFFVISGYLITSILIEDIARGRFSLLRFYDRRVRRILPALTVVMLACLPMAWAWMAPAQIQTFAASLISVVFFVSNLFFWSQTGYFDAASDLKPLLHTWSLAVEEQYYLFFPLLLVLLMRLGRARAFWSLAAMALVSLALCEWGWRHKPDATFFLIPTRAWELFAGSLCAWRPQVWDAARPMAGARSWGPSLGLGLILGPVFLYGGGTPWPSLWTLAPVLGAVLIVLFGDAPGRAGQILRRPILVGLGLISYSLYLWHQPLFAFARILALDPVPPGIMLALAGLSVVLAWASWALVERPFRRTAPFAETSGLAAWNPARLPPALAGLFATLGALVLLGLLGLCGQGFPQRYDPADRPLATIDLPAMQAYTEARFAAALHADFPDNGRVNLFLVGDSYAKDILNALAETGLDLGLNISTHHISKQCGNLDLDRDVEPYVDPRDRPLCRTSPRYDDPVVQDRLARADVVILASSWQPWQVDLLPESLTRVSEQAGGPEGDAAVFLVGRKNFGAMNIHALLNIPPAQRMAWRGPVDSQHLATQARMRALGLPGYIDLQAILCQPDGRCPVFATDHAFISYDGSHLTPQGAAFLGARLRSAAPELVLALAEGK